MVHSLEVYHQTRLVFFSDLKWIYPLFELEKFLHTTDYPHHQLVVFDKIIGKAAALLLVHFQIGQVKAQLISSLAIETLKYFNVKYEYQELVERILCKTEELLLSEMDPAVAYQILTERIRNKVPDAKR